MRFTTKERSTVEQYAEMHGATVSDVIRTAVMEKIEDGSDLEICRKALANHKKNGKTYTHEQVKEEPGLRGYAKLNTRRMPGRPLKE